MRGPSAKYLYGLTSTFGTSVNVTPAELDAWDRELAAEIRAEKQDRPITPVSDVERTIENAQRGK